MGEKNKKSEGFRIVRVFDAPREAVWRVWTDPEEAKKWWGPKGFSCPFAQIDLRVGGKYLLMMRGAMDPATEPKDYWSGGEYKEIVPLKKIVATDSFMDEKGNIVPASYYGMDADWPLAMEVVAHFEDAGENQTKFTLYYPELEGVKESDLKEMKQGWNQSLDKLEKVLHE